MTLSAPNETPDESREAAAWRAQTMDLLRRGEPVADGEFDLVYPPFVRGLSRHFWTPVQVALRAMQMLGVVRETRVLDVGAGVGKLCIVGAAATGARFTGIEHRRPLLEVARAAVDETGTTGVELVHGTIEDVAWQAFDAFYLYNPFEENLWEDRADRIDSHVELSQDRFCRDVRLVERGLERVRPGARVATYHGFGGRLRSFRVLCEERCGTGMLRVWEKVG